MMREKGLHIDLLFVWEKQCLTNPIQDFLSTITVRLALRRDPQQYGF
jgi:hypothetical protein